MIYTDRTITVQNGTSRIDSSIILYRGDREVEITFAILQQSFKFAKSDNLITTTNASYGQLIIDRPDENYIFSDITECEEGKIKFTITQAMIDELVEVGFYTIQIRLYDEPMNSRITIPPIENVIEVREPIASEDTEVLRTDGKVDEGIVNYAEAVKSEPIADTDYFDNNGNYVKTVWNGGDLITQGKLNKIEGALSVINNKAANNSGSADIDLTDYAKKNDIPTKTSQLTNDSNFATESYVKNEIASAQLGAGDIEVDLSGYATKDDLNKKADISAIPTKISQLTNDKNYITSIPSEYVTDSELASKGYLTSHQDISHLATKAELESKADSKHIHPELSSLQNLINDLTTRIAALEENIVITVKPEGSVVTLTSISATYNGGHVPVGTNLYTLSGIVVTARYSDNTSKTVTGYTLSGTIVEGNNTITVTYGGKTTTFNVTGYATVVEPDPVYYTLTITSSPSDATVKINNVVQTSITVEAGTTVSWEVSKDGYTTQSGNKVVSKTEIMSITLVEIDTGGGDEPGVDGKVTLATVDDFVSGTFLRPAGTEGTSVSYGATDYINISNYKSVIVEGVFKTNSISPVVWYDSEKTYIAGEDLKKQDDAGTKIEDFNVRMSVYYEVPVNAVYARFSSFLINNSNPVVTAELK